MRTPPPSSFRLLLPEEEEVLYMNPDPIFFVDGLRTLKDADLFCDIELTL